MDIDVTIGNDVTMRGGSAASVGRIDQYELLRELGGGGFGCVYLAKDMVAGVEVAVKGLPPEVRHNKEELENIRQNFALVSRLHHPNIAAALVLHPVVKAEYASRDPMEKLRVFERDTMMVMEYAPGVTLSQWRKQFPEKKVPLEKALDITRQVAAALDYAHGEKIVHRDVKPSNVMIETKPDGAVVARVLDFGLAAEIRSSMGRVSREIRDTSGTRPYMAPEQWRGAKQGPATDQYALAAMFCELVTGEVPFASVFDTGDPVVMLTNVTTLLPELPDSLPRGCRKTLLKALAKKPEERFASCGAFAAALSSVGRARTPAAPMLWIISTVVLLALAAVGGWWWRERLRSEELRVRNEALAAEWARKEAEDRRKAEEARIAEEERRADEERKALAAKSDEEKKRKEAEIAELKKKLAEERERIAKDRKADEERRVAEEQRKKEADQRKAEEERKAAEARESEKRRKEDEARATEVKRLVAEELARQRKADAEKQEQENRKRAEAKSQDAATEHRDAETRNVRIAEATELSVRAFAAGKWDEGRRLLKDGNADDPRLQYWQGVCAEKGHGVAVNEKMAAHFYRRSAEGGFAEAQHKYGLLCFLGRIVEKNVGEAMKWNQKAAENGNVKAQMFLAIQWDSGSVVPRNETKAEKWYRLAAENGNASAQEWLRKKGK